MSNAGPPEGLVHSAAPPTGIRRGRGAGPAADPCRIRLPTPCRHPAPCGLPCELKLGPERHAVVELGRLARLAIMAVPGTRGHFEAQARDLFAQVQCIVSRQNLGLQPTTMMIFLRDGADEAVARTVVGSVFGDEAPVTTYVVQPPVGGAALGLELWALGGADVTIQRFGPEVMSVEANGIRWVYAGGIRGEATASGAYREAWTAFQRLEQRLAQAGIGFDQVVRTWIYVNQITDGPAGHQRYQELNRARTDFYRDIRFDARRPGQPAPQTIYPASTGIGTRGRQIDLACVALDSARPDVFMVPLENPQQTAAYEYPAEHSPRSPKFSRAMALVQGAYVSTLVSGTASIVNAKSVHVGDIARQTAQTLDNIEKLIAPENFARHGLTGSGATLRDVAKLRVYVKHPSDYDACREMVEARLPGVPALYLHADVCRPELLVEIEAVAFSQCSNPSAL